MQERPLLVFDFDGVIVDGMAEYWWSSWHAAKSLAAEPHELSPEQVPELFRRLRPWIHHGWEMVLLAAELPGLDEASWVEGYEVQQHAALLRRGWAVDLLQGALDRARLQAVQKDRGAWLQLHRPFPGLARRLRSLDEEGFDWAVLTTKTEVFTAELLNAFDLRPARLDGREAGPKPEVLLRLGQERPLRGFVEDRRSTLEAVLSTEGLQELPCYLVDWGYLKPADRQQLPPGIQLIDLDRLAKPLAQWS